jgi:hypothetical protein
MKEEKEIEIINTLIESIISFDALRFLPTLLTNDIIVSYSKVYFYQFFKESLFSSKEKTIGVLTLKIEESLMDKDAKSFNFYDEIHLYPRFSIDIKKTNSQVELQLYPF